MFELPEQAEIEKGDTVECLTAKQLRWEAANAMVKDDIQVGQRFKVKKVFKQPVTGRRFIELQRKFYFHPVEKFKKVVV